jgi:hypothetical protein
MLSYSWQMQCKDNVHGAPDSISGGDQEEGENGWFTRVSAQCLNV